MTPRNMYEQTTSTKTTATLPVIIRHTITCRHCHLLALFIIFIVQPSISLSVTTTATITDKAPQKINLRKQQQQQPQQQHVRRISHHRPLPPKIIVGYTHTCDDSLFDVVKSGVNVIIWYFLRFESTTTTTTPFQLFMEQQRRQLSQLSWKKITTVTTTDDRYYQQSTHDHHNQSPPSCRIVEGISKLSCIKTYIQKLDDAGYDNIIHLTSFGGWNGPHISDNCLSCTGEELFQLWKNYGGDVFHGFDWDYEGNDTLDSPLNELKAEMLDKMGHMSELAHEEGYIVSIAPAESYLDISTSRFSRYLNLTYHDDNNWDSNFSYHGGNIYAYLVSVYGHAIDIIQVQFYESYSHAAYQISQQGVDAAEYIYDYVLGLVNGGTKGGRGGDHHRSLISSSSPGYFVDFASDESFNHSSSFVHVPLNKLVIGLANGWALNNETNKTIYITPQKVGEAYDALLREGHDIRGFMFWCVESEGANGVFLAKGLNEFMNITRLVL